MRVRVRYALPMNQPRTAGTATTPGPGAALGPGGTPGTSAVPPPTGCSTAGAHDARWAPVPSVRGDTQEPPAPSGTEVPGGTSVSSVAGDTRETPGPSGSGTRSGACARPAGAAGPCADAAARAAAAPGTDASATAGGAPLIAGLLLAAGGGRRLGGRPKALLEHRGRPLVEHAVAALREAGCGVVHVVLGAAADTVQEQAALHGCVLVENPDWEQGMGSSLRAGLESLAGTGAGAALVALVDQPGIGAAAMARVAAAYRGPGSLAAASYAGERGHPVLLGSDRWAEVAAGARGDRGARVYLRAHEQEIVQVPCADVARPYDIDTEADLGLLE